VKKNSEKQELAIAYNTESIVVLGKQLIEITEKFINKTSCHSFWKKSSIRDRINEARAIKELAKSIYELTRSW